MPWPHGGRLGKLYPVMLSNCLVAVTSYQVSGCSGAIALIMSPNAIRSAGVIPVPGRAIPYQGGVRRRHCSLAEGRVGIGPAAPNSPPFTPLGAFALTATSSQSWLFHVC